VGRPTSRTDWLATIILFGGVFLYCIVGAVRGRLFFPRRHNCDIDVYLSGLAAWSVVAAVLMLWLGVSVRMGLFPQLSPKARTVTEMLLLIAGVAFLFCSGRLPTVAPA
jgi:hypothetical protein